MHLYKILCRDFSVEGKEDKIKWSVGTLSHVLGQDTFPAPFLHSAD